MSVVDLDSRSTFHGSMIYAGLEAGVVWNDEYNAWTSIHFGKSSVGGPTWGFPEVGAEPPSNRVYSRGFPVVRGRWASAHRDFVDCARNADCNTGPSILKN